ncbi:hypothetical protein BGZ80_005602 [Entomortierella chlamydospora]|uniref:Uncharacterized protein n=1 Tax=Entomortierella chlamydospora TaxID=101097 RepID=A0A9P6MJ60_9FUNG|nr:hypothetical protein BGZ80_005602 [Entomortierella chlamydospora]
MELTENRRVSNDLQEKPFIEGGSGDLNEEDFGFKAIDFDEVDFDDSSNNESDFDGLDLGQVDLDSFYNVESNSESESVPGVETDLDADFGLMDEIDFATWHCHSISWHVEHVVH